MNQKKWTHRTSDEKAGIVKSIEQRIQEGATALEAAKEHGMPPSQFYRWRRDAAGKPNGAARTVKPRNANTEKQLLIENQRLKMIVAEQALDIQALKEWGAR